MTFIGNYKKMSLLGYGSFGNVFQVKKNGREYALKRIMKNDNKVENESALREAKILRKIHHDNIVSHFETFESKEHLCIVMECADGGTLTGHIIFNQEDKVSAEHNVWRMLECMSDAVGYLHKIRPYPIIHCDIKPDNVLLFLTRSSWESGTKYTLKLADFGVAKIMDGKEPDAKPFYTSASTRCGAAIYMAPEVLKSHPFTFSADVWSIGALAAFFCGKGDHLFPNAQDVLDFEHSSYKKKRIIPDHYSMNLRILLMDILDIDPDHRPRCGRIESECMNSRTERGKHNETKRDIA